MDMFRGVREILREKSGVEQGFIASTNSPTRGSRESGEPV